MSNVHVLSALLLRSPLLWGGALAFCFFALIHGGVISDATVVRYLAGHWVEYVEVALFCVGLASLLLKAGDLVRQRTRLGDSVLPESPEGGQDPAEAVALAAAVPGGDEEQGYLPRRLREALDLVVRTGSADDLENHLKYLSDLDAARAAQGYGLVRFVIWAIPIMGFLGTVIGITVAIACLSPTQLENISGVVAGLGTAFDTTATALGLSMVLMFLQFLIDRYEQSLRARVDEAAWTSLAGRFQSFGGGDGTTLAIVRLGETVSRGSAELLDAQRQAWQSLERSAETGIRRLLDESGVQLKTSLAQALETALAQWGDSLVRTQDAAASRREERWTQAAVALGDAVRGLERHQATLAQQTALLGAVVEATRDVTTLERALESNLSALATTGRFEETLATLAAAVQLLAARSGGPAGGHRAVDLTAVRVTGKAA